MRYASYGILGMDTVKEYYPGTHDFNSVCFLRDTGDCWGWLQDLPGYAGTRIKGQNCRHGLTNPFFYYLKGKNFGGKGEVIIMVIIQVVILIYVFFSSLWMISIGGYAIFFGLVGLASSLCIITEIIGEEDPEFKEKAPLEEKAN